MTEAATTEAPGSALARVAPEPAGLSPAPGKAMSSLPGPAKALLLLVTLDEDVATKVISTLDEGAVRALRSVSEKLDEIDPDELAAVHREFLSKVRGGVPASLNGSGPYLRRLVGNAMGEGRAAMLWGGAPKAPSTSPFGNAPPKALAALLADEHPQTVAVVLTQLDAEAAAKVVEALPEATRADIVQRLGKLEFVPSSVLADISAELGGHVAALSDEGRQEVEGKKVAGALLKRLDKEESDRLLEAMSEKDPAIADELRKSLFTFEDLLRIDGRGVQQLLKEVATDQLTLALKTASPELREKVLGNLSSRAADMLREDLELLGPTKLSDVETAQRAIIDAALRLEQEGRIQIIREGGGDFV